METNSLISALTHNDTTTENGMLTNSTSDSSLLDLFYTIGALRSEKDESRIQRLFSAAFYEDKEYAMKILFWARDIRSGAGERRVFRIIAKWLAENAPKSLYKNIKNIPEYGRWDDLIYIYENCDHDIKVCIEDLLKEALLINKNKLAGKWMPRKGNTARLLRNALNLTPKEWRKILVNLTDVVETHMCAKEWGEIDYNHVPSLAISRYTKAFYKNDKDRYEQWVNDLVKGENNAKINVGAIYPYDIIKSMNIVLERTEIETAIQQWKALPNYLLNSKIRIMPVVDVSGSMECPISGNSKTSCMDVAISLGLYISERNEGPYKDHFITFSSTPSLQRIIGKDLFDRYKMLKRSDCGMTTDITKVLELILNKAIENDIKYDDMPTHILILSDMEFDCAIEFDDKNFMDILDTLYKTAGYTKPNIIFWNLQSRNDNIPVKKDDSGTVLVSGFSPSILKNILNGEMEPFKMMMSVLDSDRYKDIVG